jgi:hypothetical protein
VRVSQETVTTGDGSARDESDCTTHDGGRNPQLENADPRGVDVYMKPDCQAGDSTDQAENT